MRTLTKGAAAAGLALASGLATASPLLWQDNSLTYLYGQDFEVDPAIQQAVTFEHVSFSYPSRPRSRATGSSTCRSSGS